MFKIKEDFVVIEMGQWRHFSKSLGGLSLSIPTPEIQLGGMGEHCKLPAESGVELQPKLNLVYFRVKMKM